MMGGGKTVLGREWFAACADFYKRQARDKPEDLGARFEDYFATSRLHATDIAILLASKTTEQISDEEFAQEVAALLTRMETFGQELQTSFTDPSCFIKTFPLAPPPSEDDITDFRDPNFCYADDYFTMNFVLIDFWAIELMFRYQLSMAQPNQPPPQILGELAFRKAKMMEAVQYCSQGPPGAILGTQASLGITSLFLPKDQKHTYWCRTKFALMERLGYVLPSHSFHPLFT